MVHFINSTILNFRLSTEIKWHKHSFLEGEEHDYVIFYLYTEVKYYVVFNN